MGRTASTPEERQALGERLRETARAAGLTSDQIAERLGVQGGSVRGWWVGRNEPSVRRLKQYADLVGVSAGYLMFGQEEERDLPEGLRQWRRQFADLIAAGIAPLDALDQVMGAEMVAKLPPALRQSLEENATVLQAHLSKASGGRWMLLSPAEQEAVLRLIETMTATRAP